MRPKEDTPHRFKRHVLSFEYHLIFHLDYSEKKRKQRRGKRLQFSVSAVSPTARINNYSLFLKKEKVLIIKLRQNPTRKNVKFYSSS